MRRRLLPLVALAGLCSSLLVVSCGKSGSTAKPPDPTPAPARSVLAPYVVTGADLRRTPPGSPSRRVLEYAQAVQFKDTGAVLGFIAPAALVGGREKLLRDAVQAIGGSYAKPQIVGTRIQGGSRATVRALMTSYDASGTPVLSIPTTFLLRRIGGEWRLADAADLLANFKEYKRRSGASG